MSVGLAVVLAVGACTSGGDEPSTPIVSPSRTISATIPQPDVRLSG